MGRLIYADKLKDERRTLPMMSNWGEMLISLLIDEQPTAYDIDRVIEQLKKVSFVDVDEEYADNGQIMLFLHDAIEIVKGGAENEIQKEAYCN